MLSRLIGSTLVCALPRTGERTSWGTNLNNFTASATLSEIFSAANQMGLAFGSPRMVLEGGGRIPGSQVMFGNVQSRACIYE
jgi:hypothetical protein